MLGFGSARIDTPLSEALPSAVKPLKSTIPSAAPKLESGTLANGTKVVAVDHASPVSSVALVFEAGSAFESDAHLGASKVLETMAFKATANRTTFRLTRELEKIGAVATAKAGRDHIAYNITATKLNSPEVVEILLDSVLNPKLNFWEVADAVTSTKAALTAALRDPSNILSDVLHRAAFDGSLAAPVHVDPSVLDHFTNATLQEYIASTLRPSSTVLAAAGVTLDEFKQLASPLVASASTPAAVKSSSSYIGGSMNVLANSPLMHVALAFESKGGLSDAKGAAAAAVVKVLLDESRSVLPRASKESDVFVSVSGFSALYKDTGLVGIIASSAPAQASQLVDAVTKKVEGLAKGVSDAQLKTAKQLAIGSYKAQASSSTGLASILAPQLLLTGKYSTSDFVASVEGLTAADVSAYVSKAVKSSPTFVTYGSLSAKIPRYEAVAKRLA